MPQSNGWTERVRKRRATLRRDEGSASLEFITAGLILLLPMVYLILTLSQIQGGSFAVEGAARQAARVFVQAETPDAGEAAARRAVDFALSGKAASLPCVTKTVPLAGAEGLGELVEQFVLHLI